MFCDPRTKRVVTHNDLDDTGREDLLCSLDDTDVAKRGEGRGLDDDRVSGNERLQDLPKHQQDGEVPGYDTSTNTKRKVAHNGTVSFALVHNLLVHVYLGEVGKPGQDAFGLHFGKHE